MPTITDKEFGDIIVKRHPLATKISCRIKPDGRIYISMPMGTPMMAAKMLIKTSRREIRRLISSQHTFSYDKNQQIGKSHYLFIEPGSSNVRTDGTKITVSIPDETIFSQHAFQQSIRDHVTAALRKEAKSYLPRRLKFLATEHNFTYNKTRLTHASSRWGSCSSRGTISLNIALMNLPFELLDYVLIHELCHTRHMNHSTAFWREVAAIDPAYKQHRDTLKKYTPHI